jgi:hypothetical protein
MILPSIILPEGRSVPLALRQRHFSLIRPSDFLIQPLALVAAKSRLAVFMASD